MKWKQDRIGTNIIRDLYVNQGLATRKVAKQLGISKTTVCSRLREIGVKLVQGRHRKGELC